MNFPRKPTADFVYAPPTGALQVIHEGEGFLIVSKPSGLLSVPGRKEEHAESMQSRVLEQFPTARIVHRLDMDTSGVMVFARDAAAQRHLGMQFEKRQIKKTYIARVWGHVADTAGHIDLPLIVDWPNRPRQHVNFETGKPAQTDWRRIRVEGDGTTRMRLFPKTGRSHQLRVHMLALGHPILGDVFYATGPARDFPRLMLHSESLKLRHPDGGKGMAFRVKTPF